MTERRRLVTILAALIPIAGGCNAIFGVDKHSLAPTPQADGGGAGTGGNGGSENYFSCIVDGAAVEVPESDAGAGMACGFTMPNSANADAGLPNPASYTKKADGTVLDNVTGLVWEGTVDKTALRQVEAVAECAKRPNGPWRLPTRIELFSIVDFTIPKPGPTFSAPFQSRPTSEMIQKFWTSSGDACGTGTAWEVAADDGSIHQKPVGDSYLIRCVKGTPSRCAQTRYTLQGDEAVDATTGLTWRRSVSDTMDWSTASKFCSTYGADWRWPSVGELETIMDTTKELPAIDRVAFPDTPPSGYFWTSNQDASNPANAWYGTVIHGHADVQPKTTLSSVRCVRLTP